ncbi:hypothetical protein nbrc107696_42230 [Gordonia spumicola]|uniref:Uncharacterized protein n=1 Tax=Gordonia spumicola TaxID=589161 RepID=A0A7I9VEM5_9ACTN|nr:hypothetical protein [Gordonia spumicola]GEE03777.1 hypothetical protein nbrc107696_42230 [Gordonia spumicola]
MNPVLITIGACEVGFWAFVVAGLALRYLARRTRASTIVLACVPLVDLILLIAVTVDLARGGDVEFAHRLAPIYLGGTLMFGHRMIGWADVRFAHRFVGGPAPAPIPPTGPVRARHEWADFGRWLGAVAIAAAITATLGYTVADDAQREALFGGFGMLGVVTVVWLLTGPIWFTAKDQAA